MRAVGRSRSGGAKSRNQSLRAQIASAPSGCLEDFSSSIAAVTRRSRSTGSSAWTGSGPRIAVSLLPNSPCSFSVRTETGTSARSSRSAAAIPRSCSQRRRAALLTASVTSLTVPPSAVLIRLNSSRLHRAQQKQRSGPISVLNGTFGAGLVIAQLTSLTPTAPSAARFAARDGWRSAAPSQRTILAIVDQNPLKAQPRSPAFDGGLRGSHGASSRTGSSTGSTSKRSVPMSTAEMPSASA